MKDSRVLACGVLAILLVLAAASAVLPQVSGGEIRGRVSQAHSAEAVPRAEITLRGPFPMATMESLSEFYKPSPALTPVMRLEIETLVASKRAGYPFAATALEARRLEAQLLGLPEPPYTPAPRRNAAIPRLQVLTDDGGEFLFQGLVPGAYEIGVRRQGYLVMAPLDDLGRQFFVSAPTASINVTAERRNEVDFLMIREGTIGGRIVDSKGRAIPLARVTAHRVMVRNFHPTLFEVANDESDDRGEYRIYGLPPGDYYIEATSPGSSSADAAATYLPHYFPGVSDLRSATKVKVGLGGDIRGLDFVVGTIPAPTISGRLASAGTENLGASGADTFVLRQRVGDAPAYFDVTVLSNSAADVANGGFEIKGVLPGSYDLIATSADSIGTVLGQTRVDVGLDSIDNVSIHRPGIEIRARLTLDGNPPPSTMAPAQRTGFTFNRFASMGVVLTSPVPRSATPVPTSTIGVLLRPSESALRFQPMETTASQNVRFDPSGLFVFPPIAAGSYRFELTRLPSNAYVADIRRGERSIYDDGLDTNDVGGEITIALKSDGGRIRGIVRDANGNPLSAARVVLVPPLPRRHNPSLYKMVFSDRSGNFSIAGIAPETYRIFAWDGIMGDAWTSPALMEHYEPLGQSLDVISNANIQVELNAIAARPGDR